MNACLLLPIRWERAGICATHGPRTLCSRRQCRPTADDARFPRARHDDEDMSLTARCGATPVWGMIWRGSGHHGSGDCTPCDAPDRIRTCDLRFRSASIVPGRPQHHGLPGRPPEPYADPALGGDGPRGERAALGVRLGGRSRPVSGLMADHNIPRTDLLRSAFRDVAEKVNEGHRRRRPRRSGDGPDLRRCRGAAGALRERTGWWWHACPGPATGHGTRATSRTRPPGWRLKTSKSAICRLLRVSWRGVGGIPTRVVAESACPGGVF